MCRRVLFNQFGSTNTQREIALRAVEEFHEMALTDASDFLDARDHKPYTATGEERAKERARQTIAEQGGPFS